MGCDHTVLEADFELKQTALFCLLDFCASDKLEFWTKLRAVLKRPDLVYELVEMLTTPKLSVPSLRLIKLLLNKSRQRLTPDSSKTVVLKYEKLEGKRHVHYAMPPEF